MKIMDSRVSKALPNIVIKEPKKSTLELVKELSCCKKLRELLQLKLS